MARTKKKKLTIMVSSTVYGIEELLDRVYTLLTTFGYEIWCSHKGTVQVWSTKTAFDNCLEAVEKCDLFLGIITPQYGSGVQEGDQSITHQEMKKAIELDKPRWFLAHDQVVFARKLLNDLGFKTPEQRSKLQLKKKATSISDLRVVQMYEEATMEHLPLDDRQGNWVQKFDRDDDANLFVVSQFSRYQEVEERLKENLSNSDQLRAKLKEKSND
ncbi:hypothetical protein BVY04_01515 [bacterium M21]|nr:hypothetical protein BVY04_01515 [bacterium M21]